MTAITWESKDPDEVLDYSLDWSTRLGADTISTSDWPDFPAGLTNDNETNTTTTTTIWLSGGTAGNTYQLTNRIVTTGGRTYDQTVILFCKEA